MGKKITVSLIVVLLFFSIVVSPSFAHHRARVLGESTQAAELVFPQVSAGPGFLLPDSPFYIFDVVWQKIKIATAFSEEAKAKVHTQVAGERLAELRIMLSRNNPEGIAIALSQMQKEADSASQNLSDASAKGENVEEAAKTLNEAIKLQRKVLGLLANQTDGQLRLQIKATREALKQSKIEVEDELPDELLEKEIEEQEKDELEEDIDEALDLTEDIEDEFEDEDKEASKAAKQATENLRKLQNFTSEQKSGVSNSGSSNSGSGSSGSNSGSSGSGSGGSGGSSGSGRSDDDND